MKQGCLAVFQEHGFVFFDLGLLSGRFKEYQDMFPPRPMEVEIEVQPVSQRKPSKAAMHLQESQVSEEEEKRAGQTGKPVSLLTFETPLEELLLELGVVS